MIRQERGFSLVELMITIVIFIMVIAASSQIFTSLLTQFKQQSKIGETDIEGAIGLDILRRDLAHAGFGLPGNLNGTTYQEAADDSAAPAAQRTIWDERNLNDGPPGGVSPHVGRGCADPDTAPCKETMGNPYPPGAVRSLNNVGIHNTATANAIANSVADVLAIKGAAVGMSNASQRWTYISNTGALPNLIRSWGTTSQDTFLDGDRVVVMRPEPTAKVNILQHQAGTFWTTFGSINPAAASPFQPAANSYESYVAYGIDQNTDPRMPFNRADYYVKRPASGMPARCAPNTGILYKGTVNQSDGLHTELPILDCVADMQVRYCIYPRVCSTHNQTACKNDSDCPAPDTCPATQTYQVDDGTIVNNMQAEMLRDYLKDIQVYIVAQEGQRDNNYDFSNNDTRERFSPYAYCGSTAATSPTSNKFDMVNLKTLAGCEPGETSPNCTTYKKYHWRLYTIVQRPTSMR